MKNLIHLITPVVFMFFFVSVAGAQSESKCNPKDCNVKCCSPQECAALVDEGKCTPQQAAACKSLADTKVASMIKVKGEPKTNTEATRCVKAITANNCTKAKVNTCKASSTKLVSIEKLNNPKTKPVTKDQ